MEKNKQIEVKVLEYEYGGKSRLVDISGLYGSSEIHNTKDEQSLLMQLSKYSKKFQTETLAVNIKSDGKEKHDFEKQVVSRMTPFQVFLDF